MPLDQKIETKKVDQNFSKDKIAAIASGEALQGKDGGTPLGDDSEMKEAGSRAA